MIKLSNDIDEDLADDFLKKQGKECTIKIIAVKQHESRIELEEVPFDVIW